MGKPMSATPTPESMVGQGGTNTLENRCHTTPPLKGGRGWWGVHHLFGVGWGNVLIPMPRFLCRGGTAGRGYAFALWTRSDTNQIQKPTVQLPSSTVIFSSQSSDLSNSQCSEKAENQILPRSRSITTVRVCGELFVSFQRPRATIHSEFTKSTLYPTQSPGLTGSLTRMFIFCVSTVKLRSIPVSISQLSLTPSARTESVVARTAHDVKITNFKSPLRTLNLSRRLA